MNIRRVAVLTSGGDAPGMNAAIRAAVRAGCGKGWQMFGIRYGYQGLIDGNVVRLEPRDVGGIIDRGGTLLHTARAPEFETPEGRRKGLDVLREHDIDALMVIGGGGSQKGSHKLVEEGFPVIGIASTIDNDLYGSDISLGVNTALNTALESIDKIRTTASSHERAFLVEVMGRDCGYLALISGIAGGAESIVIPEVPVSPEEVAEEIRAARNRGKSHAIVVVAEGARCNAEELVGYFRQHRERLGFELRMTRLGHVQRGGIPTAFDRMLGTRLAAAGIDRLEHGEYGVLMGLMGERETATPLSDVAERQKSLDLGLLSLAKILAQ